MIKCLQPKLLFSCTELFQVRPLSNVGSSARSTLLKRRSSENWLTLWLCVADENNCSHQIKELAVVMKCEKISQKFNRIVLQNLPWKKTKVIKFWVFFVVVFSLFFYTRIEVYLWHNLLVALLYAIRHTVRYCTENKCRRGHFNLLEQSVISRELNFAVLEKTVLVDSSELTKWKDDFCTQTTRTTTTILRLLILLRDLLSSCVRRAWLRLWSGHWLLYA